MGKRFKKMHDENGEEYFVEDKNSLETIGEGMQGCGQTMSGCGCLLTLFVTIPIILFFLGLFF